MKGYKSNFQTLRRSSPAKMGRRFIACVIDMVIVFLVAAAIFAGAFAIAQNTAAYKKATTVIEDETTYFETVLMPDTHLLEFVDGKQVRDDVVAYINLLKAVKVSYEKNDKDFSPFFDKITTDNLEDLKIQLSELDDVTHFYTVYIPANKDLKIVDMGQRSPIDYLKDVYFNTFGETDYHYLFDQSETNSTPVLRESVAESLFHYFTVSSEDTLGKQGAEYSDIFINTYSSMLRSAKELMGLSEPYYSTHYIFYFGAIIDKGRITNIALIISIILAYCIVVLLPKLLFENGISLGYKLLGLGVIKDDGRKLPWYYTLIKMVPEIFGFLTLTFFMYLLPPFEGIYDEMFWPFTMNSFFSLGGIILIVALLALIINAFGLFTHSRQTLFNIILKDMVVDTKYIDEGDREELFSGRPY